MLHCCGCCSSALLDAFVLVSEAAIEVRRIPSHVLPGKTSPDFLEEQAAGRRRTLCPKAAILPPDSSALTWYSRPKLAARRAARGFNRTPPARGFARSSRVGSPAPCNLTTARESRTLNLVSGEYVTARRRAAVAESVYCGCEREAMTDTEAEVQPSERAGDDAQGAVKAELVRQWPQRPLFRCAIKQVPFSLLK